MDIIRITNKDIRFYPMLGPFLARREIEREIGYKIYDDDGKEWLIAIEVEHVIGFCYIVEKSKFYYQIGSCYVLEGYRRKGIFRKLLHEAIKGIKGTVCLITKNPILKEMLIKEGFIETGNKGSFIEYGKEL